MSGLPYPEGVTRVINLLDIVAKGNSEAEMLQERIRWDKARLAEIQEATSVAWRDYKKAMNDMDVSLEGNAGFERRAAWFLAEMRRQVVHGVVDPTKDVVK